MTTCPGNAIACGKTCCQPGQVCQGDTCVNGALEAGDLKAAELDAQVYEMTPIAAA